MFSIGEFLRLLAIQRILIRHGLDEIILATHLLRPLSFVLHLLPWNWFRRNHDLPTAVRLRMVLEDLGPVFVKLGQQLSTRRDMLSEDIADEFEKLQAAVSPFPGHIARHIVEQAFDCPIDDIFSQFDEKPLASGSIAQVHTAQLKDGRDMIVKVVRPDAERVIRRDIGLLYFLARQAEHYSSDGEKLKPTNVVNEFEKTLLNELDLMREAANASQLKRNLKDSEFIYIPDVDWDLTRKNVMVMERVSGIPVSDMNRLKEKHVDLKWLAHAGVDVFFTQVFRDSFFHADMHPGNIFINVDESKPRIMLVDFGIVSSLSEFDQRYLAENFLAFLEKDYQRVAALHVESGWVPAGTRVDEFEQAIRAVCEPLFDRPLKEISFGMLLLRLFQTARRFNMVILPQLILLQKTVINVEGLGRELHPDLNLWEAARPSLEQWMKDRVGIKGLYKGVKKNIPHWLDRLPDLPNKAVDIIERIRDGRIHFELNSKELEQLNQQTRRNGSRLVLAIIAAALIISSAIIFSLDGYQTQQMWFGVPIMSVVTGFLGLIVSVCAVTD